MRDEHQKSTEHQAKHLDEMERLKKKLAAYENTSTSSSIKHHNSTSSLNHSIANSKQHNKENHDTNNTSSSSLVRNLIDTIESTSNILLTSITNECHDSTTLPPTQTGLTNTLLNNKSSKYVANTDTDDAKMMSSRVRSNSSTNESSSSSSPSSLSTNHSKNPSCVEYLILNPSKSQSSTTQTSQMTDANGYNYSIYSTLPYNSKNASLANKDDSKRLG